MITHHDLFICIVVAYINKLLWLVLITRKYTYLMVKLFVYFILVSRRINLGFDRVRSQPAVKRASLSRFNLSI